MERGAIRRLAWVKQDLRARAGATWTERVDAIAATRSITAPSPSDGVDEGEDPVLDPPPTSAEEKAIALLRIAAEIEGVLLAEADFDPTPKQANALGRVARLDAAVATSLG